MVEEDAIGGITSERAASKKIIEDNKKTLKNLIGACHQAKIFVDPERKPGSLKNNRKRVPGMMVDPFAK